MSKKGLKGYTLIEILLVILILGILSGVILSTYQTFFREASYGSVTIKKEEELLSLHYSLKKLISSTGFGIPFEEKKEWNATCDNFDAFQNSDTVIGIAKNCSVNQNINPFNYDELYFKSLYVPGERYSGCWWAIIQGNSTTQAIDKRGVLCPNPGSLNAKCLLLDLKGNFRDLIQCNALLSSIRSGILFYVYDTVNTEVDYKKRASARLFLRSLNEEEKKECAPWSSVLELQKDGSTQPLINCVGGMKFQFLSQNSPPALRMCILIQVSGRTSTKRTLPTSLTCGQFQVPSSWEHYRWRLIEEVIPLENLKGANL